MLFDALTRSFAALGGVARRSTYDNMRTAVDKILKGKGRVVNARCARLYPTRAGVVADDVIVADHQRLMDKSKIATWPRIGPFVARATGHRSPTFPSRCKECAERCCARPAAIG